MRQTKHTAKRPAARDRPGGSAVQTCTLSGLPQLPEFHLLWEPEPAAPERPALQPGEQQHIAALLAQYEHEEGSLQVCCHPASIKHLHRITCMQTHVRKSLLWLMHAQVQMGEASSSEVAAAEGTWAGEGYEKASALSPDAAFHRFAKRLRRHPQQCARAGPSCELLWPKSNAPPSER